MASNGEITTSFAVVSDFDMIIGTFFVCHYLFI